MRSSFGDKAIEQFSSCAETIKKDEFNSRYRDGFCYVLGYVLGGILNEQRYSNDEVQAAMDKVLGILHDKQ